MKKAADEQTVNERMRKGRTEMDSSDSEDAQTAEGLVALKLHEAVTLVSQAEYDLPAGEVPHPAQRVHMLRLEAHVYIRWSYMCTLAGMPRHLYSSSQFSMPLGPDVVSSFADHGWSVYLGTAGMRTRAYG